MRDAKNARGRRHRRGRLARLARRLRRAGDQRRRHPGAGPPHPRPGRDARRHLPGRAAPKPRRASGSPPSRSMDGADLARTVTPAASRSASTGDGPARGRDRHRDQAQHRPPAARARLPADPAALHQLAPSEVLGRGSRPRLPRQRPRRSRGARLRRRHRPRAGRQAAGLRHLPRPPAALPGGRPARPSSCRSATAAPTTRSRTWRPAGSTSPPRTTASPSGGPAASRGSRATSRSAGRPTSAPPSSPT